VVETQDTATTADDENYWFVYDGNGDVGQVLDATDTSDVSLAAHYEYDPYGDTLVVDDVDSSGYADDNPYRFSTKWLDDDLTTGDNNGRAIESSGLYYYGFRYYSPNLGRWISRDPLGNFEPIRTFNFKNLYIYADNASLDHYDPLGLCTAGETAKGWSGELYAIRNCDPHESYTEEYTVERTISVEVSVGNGTVGSSITVSVSVSIKSVLTAAPCDYAYVKVPVTCTCVEVPLEKCFFGAGGVAVCVEVGTTTEWHCNAGTRTKFSRPAKCTAGG
jgi:RHS repeat-associated protein